MEGGEILIKVVFMNSFVYLFIFNVPYRSQKVEVEHTTDYIAVCYRTLSWPMVDGICYVLVSTVS